MYGSPTAPESLGGPPPAHMGIPVFSDKTGEQLRRSLTTAVVTIFPFLTQVSDLLSIPLLVAPNSLHNTNYTQNTWPPAWPACRMAVLGQTSSRDFPPTDTNGMFRANCGSLFELHELLFILRMGVSPGMGFMPHSPAALSPLQSPAGTEIKTAQLMPPPRNTPDTPGGLHRPTSSSS